MKHWKEVSSSTVQPDIRPPQLPDCDADTNVIKTLISEVLTPFWLVCWLCKQTFKNSNQQWRMNSPSNLEIRPVSRVSSACYYYSDNRNGKTLPKYDCCVIILDQRERERGRERERIANQSWLFPGQRLVWLDISSHLEKASSRPSSISWDETYKHFG